MCATGHDQEWCPGNLFPELFAHVDAHSNESFEDQRFRDGSDRAPYLLSGSAGCGNCFIEHVDPTGQARCFEDVVHGLTVRMHVDVTISLSLGCGAGAKQA